MARTKTRTSTGITRLAHAPQTIVVRPVPGTGGGHKKKHHHRRGGGAGKKPDMMNAALAGFIISYIEKNYGAQLPSIPVLGDTGTIALLAYYFRGKHKMLPTIALVAAGLAAYQYEATGTITGMEGAAAWG